MAPVKASIPNKNMQMINFDGVNIESYNQIKEAIND